MSYRILITGKNSYIGTSIEQWLNQSPEDFLIDTIDTRNNAWKKADFSKYDVVFHVAGIAHANAKEDQRDLYYKVNTDLTIEIAKHAKRNIYDTDFNLLNVKATREHFDDHLVKKPNNFEEMIKIAEDLAKPFVFSRIDLYNIRGKIYFGEITFYPGSGNQILEPEEWEQKLGSWIDLDSDKIITE